MRLLVGWEWGTSLMGKLVFSLILGILPIAANANYFPPQDVQKLIEHQEVLNDKCRGGSGKNPKTWQACKKRDEITKKIEKKGYCKGSVNKDAYGYEKEWIPCKLDRTRAN